MSSGASVAVTAACASSASRSSGASVAVTAAKLVKRVMAHSGMEGWSVKNLGKQPMEFVATHRAIYGHLLRQESAGNIDLSNCLPTHFFFASSGVKCLKSWVSAKKAEYEEQDEEEW